MAAYRYLASALLADLITRIESTDPDGYEAPDLDAPKRAVHIGSVTEYQKALMALRRQMYGEHDELHESLGMPFGANFGLPPEHRLLHLGPEIVGLLIAEDLSQTLQHDDVGEIAVDRNWDVYSVQKRPFLMRVLLWASALVLVSAGVTLIFH